MGEGQDVLLFVDNIFRFTQAGSEVSALLGRIPSAVGYQPTLATDLAMLQERITTTQKGSITSVQAVYVPADDLTDPAPATTFAHVGPVHRRTEALRHCPQHAEDPSGLQVPAGHYCDLGYGRVERGGQARRGSRTQGAALHVSAILRR